MEFNQKLQQIKGLLDKNKKKKSKRETKRELREKKYTKILSLAPEVL